MALAEKAGIPLAPVARPQDLFDDPHLNQSDSLATTTLPGGGVTQLLKPHPLEVGPASLASRFQTRYGEFHT